MKKLPYFFVCFFVLIFSLSFVSSNFVCGSINNSKDFASSWTNVRVYYEENSSDFTQCKVNPENKFCCDLENISSVDFAVGKKVFAEVFDKIRGFTAGPVSLSLTDAGYDIFPEMNLEKTIVTTLSGENLFINQSSIPINFSLAKGYRGFSYIVNSSEGYLEKEVCKDCRELEFSIPLFKGRNEIMFISNASREISEKIVVYNLDYFNFNVNFSCDKCKLKKNFFYAPSGEQITVHSSFNSSHNLSGDFLFYFPSEWVSSDSLNTGDFSFTHKGMKEQVINKKEFSVDYVLKSPKTFIKQDYTFYQKLNEYELLTKVRVFKIKLMPFHKSNPFEKSYANESLEQRTSPDEPVVINSKEDYLKLVAIFPKEEILKSYSNLNFGSNKLDKNKKHFFTILTTIPQKDIEKILLVFRAEKGKNIEVYSNNKIPLEFYEEDLNYTYYSAYVSEKGPFMVKIF